MDGKSTRTNTQNSVSGQKAHERPGKLIVDAAELDHVLQQIDESKEFGLDLEFIPERTYYPIICLVQINVQDKVYLVDPIKLQDLNLLWQRVADPSIVKVVHAASQDLTIIFQRSNLIPQNIFDTQIAAGFLGLGHPAGYGKLLASLFDITLSKTESFTDWQARPLSQSQIDYAIDDALHLLPLYHRIKDQLVERNRLEWVIEECRLYEQPSYYIKESGREFLRVKGAQGLHRRKLAVLQALCLWRDQEAKRKDKPARSVLSDNIMLELARKPPEHLSDIQRIRGVRPDQLQGWGKHIIRVVEETRSMPETELPQWPSGRAPSKSDVLIADVLYMVLKLGSQDLAIAPELISTREELQSFVRLGKAKLGSASSEKEGDESDHPLMNGWRFELVGSQLLKILDGSQISLTIAPNSETPVRLSVEKD
ncbi:MAG: ribonuclease D [Cyanobacteria bacterium SZAS LIN-2]|nr:ribonuclease D [Cyanobacteria bacterium SZAS LIN-2]